MGLLKNSLRVCGVGIVLVQLIIGVYGWGKHGHYATCKIAECQKLTLSVSHSSLLPLPAFNCWDTTTFFPYLQAQLTPLNTFVYSSPISVSIETIKGLPLEHVTCFRKFQGYLSKDAWAAVKELLPASAEGELAAVCSWPDLFVVRSHYYWSRALHFVDTPDFMCNYKYSRDCHDSAGRENRCVTGAIYNYTQQLMSACHNSVSGIGYNLTEALMFLSHFVGDVHQPLHCGFLGDLGGNRIMLHWYGRKANLHHVWDTEIIDTALKRFYDSDLSIMIEAMQKNITENWSNYVESWEECESNRTVCPNPYASESVSLACKYAYRNATPGSVLKDDYFLTRLPIVERRLAQGGIRLAATLNRIFDSCGLISASRGVSEASDA